MKAEEKFEIIKRNTEEIITEEELKKLLEEKKKISAYYGTAPTGPFHIAYLIPLMKLYEMQKLGIKVKVLIANIHAALDDLKTPWEEIDKRADYYEKCIKLSLPWPEETLFVKGTDFQLDKNYMLDVLKLSTLTTVARATRAASEVTRMKNPKVSELIYPIMQALDEEYLNVDIQVGGIDQRHIMALAREYLPKLNYRPRVEVMTALISSLKGPGSKMSASIPRSHIKVYDNETTIRKTIKNAYCPEKEIKDNPILDITKYIIFTLKDKLLIERSEKFGGDIIYESYQDLEKDFINGKLHPLDLKNAVAEELIKIFARARKYFQQHKSYLLNLGEEYLSSN